MVLPGQVALAIFISETPFLVAPSSTKSLSDAHLTNKILHARLFSILLSRNYHLGKISRQQDFSDTHLPTHSIHCYTRWGETRFLLLHPPAKHPTQNSSEVTMTAETPGKESELEKKRVEGERYVYQRGVHPAHLADFLGVLLVLRSSTSLLGRRRNIFECTRNSFALDRHTSERCSAQGIQRPSRILSACQRMIRTHSTSFCSGCMKDKCHLSISLRLRLQLPQLTDLVKLYCFAEKICDADLMDCTMSTIISNLRYKDYPASHQAIDHAFKNTEPTSKLREFMNRSLVYLIRGFPCDCVLASSAALCLLVLANPDAATDVFGGLTFDSKPPSNPARDISLPNCFFHVHRKDAICRYSYEPFLHLPAAEIYY